MSSFNLSIYRRRTARREAMTIAHLARARARARARWWPWRHWRTTRCRTKIGYAAKLGIWNLQRLQWRSWSIRRIWTIRRIQHWMQFCCIHSVVVSQTPVHRKYSTVSLHSFWQKSINDHPQPVVVVVWTHACVIEDVDEEVQNRHHVISCKDSMLSELM